MSRQLRQWVWSLVACGLVAAAFSLPAKPPEVRYDSKSRELSVEATGQPLLEVLGQLAAQTGWHIFVEPDSNPKIRTEFKDVGVGRAIDLLVGDMNYALVPQREGPTKLFVFRTSRDQATVQVPAADDHASGTATIRRVGNELIVTVAPGTDIEALAKRLGAKVAGRLPGTNTYRLTFPDDTTAESARTQLASEPGVKGVDYNYVVDRPNPAQSVAQGAAPPIKLTLNPPPANGAVVVGLVDTAVQSMGADLDKFLLPAESIAGQATLPSDQLTHGTSMAETILRSIQDSSGGSTSIRILPVDVYGPNDNTTSFDVALGIAAAVNSGANVINLSLGSYGTASYLQDVIQEASQKGIAIFGAAGNEPVTNPVYPAAYPEVVAVTAVQGNQLAPYANHGSFVDMAAPGSSVVYFDGQPYVVSGTSTATALASGLAASVAESQQLSPTTAAAAVSQRYSVSFPTNP